MDVLINLYLVDKSSLFESEIIHFDDEIKTIEQARVLIIKYLGEHYSDCKYNIGIYNSFDGKETSINLVFEDSLFVKRDIILKELLRK